jgi:hypothetical protein
MTGESVRHLIAILVLWAIATTVLMASSPPETMTDDAIERAIAFGRSTEPQPYQLHHISGRSENRNPFVVGSVYTPFIRVALASRRAMLDDKELPASQLDKTLVQPMIYVAIRHITLPIAVQPSDVRVVLTELSDLEGKWGTPPVWIKAPSEALGLFEANEKTQTFVVVAAFPIEAVQPDLQFIIERKRFFSRSPISHSELARWR